MHGGDSSITDVDLDERRVSINLSGACSGCGVSPMTTQAIQQRLPAEIDDIDHVSVSTGLDGLAEQGSSGRDVPPDTPSESGQAVRRLRTRDSVTPLAATGALLPRARFPPTMNPAAVEELIESNLEDCEGDGLPRA